MVLSKLAEGAAAAWGNPAVRKVALAAVAAYVANRALLGSGKGSAKAAAQKEKDRKKEAAAAASSLGKRSGRGQVDARFFKRLRGLLRIAVPGVLSREAVYLAVLAGFLVARTFLSIKISSVNGTIVEAIVQRNFPRFLRRLAVLASIAVPASCINSMLKYLGNKLALFFRTRLVHHFHERYLRPKMYYQLLNVDSRVENPDQALTETIDLWAKALSELYSNVTKPLLDIALFSQKLAEVMGAQGPLTVIGYYLCSGVLIRVVSPPFGKLTAEAQRREGEFRYQHHQLLTHAEEVAFLGGHRRELSLLNGRFSRISEHMNELFRKQLFMGALDGFLVKHGAVLVGYAVLGLPVFGPGATEYVQKLEGGSSVVMRDYIRNSGLLINLAKAIGRVATSYKDLQRLAGYTSLVSQLDVVLNDLEAGKYERKFVEGADALPAGYAPGAGSIELRDDGVVEFDRVPLVTPNGDLLVDNVSFRVEPGRHVFISGPNGSGKSSLFRLLGELWPSFGGTMSKPPDSSFFYIPQKAFLGAGTLRDQVIYPHSPADMFVAGRTDDELMQLLEHVKLTYLVSREGGWNAEADWADVLSGGEKQRIAFARLLYHRPKYAILDECTSAVSVDVERWMYEHAKEVGITIITVSHRPSLLRHHEFRLALDGRGGYTYGPLVLPDNFDDTP